MKSCPRGPRLAVTNTQPARATNGLPKGGSFGFMPAICITTRENTVDMLDQRARELSSLLERHVSRSEVAHLATAVARLEDMAALARTEHVETRGRKRKD